jgi:hypothetical protein
MRMTTAELSAETVAPVFDTTARVDAWDTPYLEVVQFLSDEAALLDADRLEDWLALLAEDISYLMPVRVTRLRNQGTGFSAEMRYPALLGTQPLDGFVGPGLVYAGMSKDDGQWNWWLRYRDFLSGTAW